MLRFIKIGTLPEFRESRYSGSQAPCTELLEDKLRVYFSARDEKSRSFPFYYDVSLSDPTKILDTSNHPLLFPGFEGQPDRDGCMISQIIGNKMLYTGWKKGNEKIRFHTSLCVAYKNSPNSLWYQDHNSNFLLANKNREKSMEFIFNKEKWYMNFLPWKDSEPFYEINKGNKTIIKLNENSGGLARPALFKLKNKTILLYSERGKSDYRTNINEMYKLKYAKKGLFGWKEGNIEIINDPSFLQAYAFPQWVNKELYIFYNSQSFTSPISVAKLVN